MRIPVRRLLVHPAALLAVLVSGLVAAPRAVAEAGGAALSFASARQAGCVLEPRVEIARIDLVVRAGDALEYELLVPAPVAERAGVEITFADGRRTRAPTCVPDSTWRRVRVPLDAFEGAQVAGVELVARGSLAGEIGFRVDEVVVTRAGSDPIVVFRDTLPGGALIVRDDARRAGAVLVPVAAGWQGARALIGEPALAEPWSAYDLTNLRKSFEIDGITGPGPRGGQLVGACVPMRFALPGQSAFVRATGQRFSFQPVEGGRHYTVWMAISTDDGASAVARAYAFGSGGERRAVDFSVPAAGADGGDALDLGGCFLVEMPVASLVPLHGIQLPDDRRVRIHAITFQWRRDGANAKSFRLAWLGREALLNKDIETTRRMGLSRYVRNRLYGPLFQAPAPGEDEIERALCEALLRGDTRDLGARLRDMLGAQSTAGAPLKALRIALEDVRDDRGTLRVGSGIGAEELVRTILALPSGAAAVIDADLAELRQAPQLLRSSGIDSALVTSSDLIQHTPIARWLGPESTSVHLAGAIERVDDLRELGDLPWQEWIAVARQDGSSTDLFVPVAGTEQGRADAAALVAILSNVDIAPSVRCAGAEEFVAQAVKRMGTGVPSFSPGDLAPLEEAEAPVTRDFALRKRRATTVLGLVQTFGTIARGDGARAADTMLEALWGDPEASLERGRAALHDQLEVLARGATTTGEGTPIVAFNPLPWPRRTLITLEMPGARLVGSNGKALPSQPTSSGGNVFALVVPALGFEVLHGLRPEENRVPVRTLGRVPLVVEGWTARNDQLAFTLDPESGAITSLQVLPEGIEMLSAPARLSGEGWTVESAAFVERGPLRAVARVELASPHARATVELVLASHARTLEVRCTLDSTASEAAAFDPPEFDLPLLHGALRALAGVAFGSSPAAPLADGRPARHRLLDWIVGTDGTAGLAVLAGECSTVLVAPRRLMVELEAMTDASTSRTTTFALLPFAGPWRTVGLSQHAQELESPVELVVTDAHSGGRGSNHAFVSISRVARDGPLVHGPESGVMLTALQPAVGGGWLLRLVETTGQPQDVLIEFDRPVFAAQRADLRGSPIGALRHEEGRVRITLGARRVENVLVRMRP